MPDWLDATSMPCLSGECAFHTEHPPCNRGWLDADHVCPCWAARRRVNVRHTDPDPIPTTGTPMPATVRAAWNTARKTLPGPSAITPAWVPTGKARPALPAPQKRPEPVAVDRPAAGPTPDPVLDQLPTADVTPAQRAELVAALNKARAAGWTDPELATLLHANTDPNRPPARLWLYVLRRCLTEPRIVDQAAA